MLQEGKPIAYASKSLKSTEENYAQIEKELYAVVFGCKRFHEYMYGRRVIVESDHKPLEAILKKPLAAAPPLLQRMILSYKNMTSTSCTALGRRYRWPTRFHVSESNTRTVPCRKGWRPKYTRFSTACP